MPPLPPVTLALLAGGRGTRMGTPKSHLRLRGQPILRYLYDRFAWSGPTLLVTAPGLERPPGHQLFSAEITDPVEGQGPLRGIHTALAAATTELVVITPVDMPAVLPGQLEELAGVLAATADVGAIFLRRQPAHIEPFPSAFRKTLLPQLEARLAAGRFSVQSLADDTVVFVRPAPAHWLPMTWTNLNKPEDLAEWEAAGR